MNFAGKFAATALLATSLLMGGCGQAQIGCVDRDKVLSESPRGKKAVEDAKADIDKKVKEFDEKYANKTDIPEEEAAKAQLELQRELQKIQQKHFGQLESKFNLEVANIAQQKNIDVVIANPADQKILFKGGIDITDEVIKKMQ